MSVVEAFDIAIAAHGLTEEEAGFVFKVLARLRTIAVEARTRAKELMGFEPETLGEKLAAASIIWAADPDPRSPMEDLTVGINNYPRREIILSALRDIAKASLPAEVLDCMLEVFS